MLKLLSLAVLLSSSLTWAESFVSKVHSVVEGKGNEDSIIKFENGRVAFVSNSNKSVRSINDLYQKNLRVVLDERANLLDFKTLHNPTHLAILEEENIRPNFEPTVLGSVGEVKDMFNRLNQDYKRRSECSDRAHVWAWEEFKRNGTKTEKVFAFFTASYINRNKFKWWFHVAPLVSAKNGDKVEKYVLDFQFVDRPVKIKEWTDLLVFSKRECKMTTKFSEYDVNPQTEDCYMMIDSMYNRLPGDLHSQELQGVYRTDWNEGEVRNSYNWAFTTPRGEQL